MLLFSAAGVELFLFLLNGISSIAFSVVCAVAAASVVAAAVFLDPWLTRIDSYEYREPLTWTLKNG